MIDALRQGSLHFRDPQRFHDRQYLISVVCRVFKNSKGVVHRGLVWRVLRNDSYSPIIAVIDSHSGQNWEVAREPELFMNGGFEVFSRQVEDLISTELEDNVTLELQVGGEYLQVSNEYFKTHGLSRENEAWRLLAQHYTESPAEHVSQSREHSGISGYREAEYREEANSRLDGGQSAQFSPEQEREAERQREVLEKIGV